MFSAANTPRTPFVPTVQPLPDALDTIVDALMLNPHMRASATLHGGPLPEVQFHVTGASWRLTLPSARRLAREIHAAGRILKQPHLSELARWLSLQCARGEALAGARAQ